MHTITIAEDFSRTPGARYIKDGPFSGELFRQKFLEPLFSDLHDHSKIKVVFDGADGYATSFLEESFGGLARVFGPKRCIERLELVSNEDELLIEEVNQYMKEAEWNG